MFSIRLEVDDCDKNVLLSYVLKLLKLLTELILSIVFEHIEKYCYDYTTVSDESIIKPEFRNELGQSEILIEGERERHKPRRTVKLKFN